MPRLRTRLSSRQNFRPIFGHQNGMLKLRGQSSIARPDSPTVVLIQPGEPGSCIDHGLNRKAHAGQYALLPRLAIGEMRHIRWLVKGLAQAMPDIFTDY